MSKKQSAGTFTSYGSHDYGTGPVFLEIIRDVFADGHIHLDPFSSEKWNHNVGAEHILTAKDDGFAADWPLWCAERGGATVLVNVPGDRAGQNAKRAWARLDLYHRAGMIGGGAVWVAYNLNQLQTLQRALDRWGLPTRSPMHTDFVRLVPATRQPYEEWPGVLQKQPQFPSFMLLMPGTASKALARDQVALFRRHADRLGGSC